MAPITTNHRVFADVGLIAWVKVGVGPEEDRDWKSYPVDPKTGAIAIPHDFLPANAPSKGKWKRGRYVQAFELRIGHEPSDDVLYVVTQRGVGNEYDRLLPGFGHKLSLFNFSAVPVEWRERDERHQDAEGRKGPAIFTAMKSKGDDCGVNRIDVWVFYKDGRVALFQILVTSFDDGKSFGLVGSFRWMGRAFRLPERKAYLPQTSKPALYNPMVLEVIDHLIFEPDGAFTGIDSRAEVFENNPVLDFLEDHMTSFEVWSGRERNFSVSPTIEGVQLSGMRGYLKWFSHGVSGCGFGIVIGADGVERQVRYHSFGDDTVRDAQGMLAMMDGDVIEWDEEIDMGYNERMQRPHPKLLCGVRVQLISNERRRAKGIVPGQAAVAA